MRRLISSSCSMLQSAGTPGDFSVAACLVGAALVLVASPLSAERQSTTLVEFEALASSAAVSAGAVVAQPMASFGPGWSGDAQLFWRPPAPQETPISDYPHLSMLFEAPAAGDYDLVLHHTVAPDYGNFTVLVAGKKAAEVVGYAPAVAVRQVALGRHRLAAEPSQIVFTVFGKEAASSAYIVGLDRLESVPATSAVTAIGARRGFIETQPPEPTPGTTELPPVSIEPRDSTLEFALIEASGRVFIVQADETEVELEELDAAWKPGFVVPRRLWAADIDGNGVDDLLRWMPATRALGITRLSDSGVAGETTLENYWTSQQPNFMTADLDGDGRAEVLGSDPASATITIVGFDNAGEPVQRVEIADAWGPPIGLRVRLVGQNRDQLLVVGEDGELSLVSVSETLNDYKSATIGSLAAGARISYGDLDGDKMLEILSHSPSTGFVEILELGANGDLTDRRPVGQIPVTARFSLRAADIDGDTLEDIVIKDRTSRTMSVGRLSPTGLLVVHPLLEYEEELPALLHPIGSGSTLVIVHPGYLRMLDIEPGFEAADYTDLPLDGIEIIGVSGRLGNFDGD